MRRILFLAAWGLLTLGQVPGIAADKSAKPETCSGEFGTSLQFEKTPSEAAHKAQKEEKLVFVLHISGYFEDPDFT